MDANRANLPVQGGVGSSGEEVVNKEGSPINLKWIFATLLAIWPWLLGSVIVSLVVGNLYLRYSTPIYKTSAEILINDSKKGGSGSGGQDVLDVLQMNSSKVNVDNEMRIMRSRTLMTKVVKSLHLNVMYFLPGRLKTTAIYKNRPFNFVLVDSQDDYASYKLIPNTATTFDLIQNKKKATYKWGDTITLSIGRVVVQKTPFFAPSDDQYTVNIAMVKDIMNKYMYALDLTLPNKQSSSIYMTLTDEIPSRAEDVLNKLMELYMQANVDDRSRINNSTLAFIDNRLLVVNQDLTNIEKSIEGFKRNNKLVGDMTDQTASYIQGNADVYKMLTEQEVQMDIITSVEKEIKDNHDKNITLPASLMDNKGLSDVMDKYNTLQIQKENTLVSSTEDNPIVKSLEKQEQEIKASVLSNIEASKVETQIKINNLQDRLGMFKNNIASAPTSERSYIDFSRQQGIKQDIFVFLLKKREETLIEKSGTVANASIVDPAKSDDWPIKPSRTKILISSLLIGLALPMIFLFIRRSLNIRIISKADIIKATRIPILGEIGHSQSAQNISVQKNSRTAISEQFRALRTNLQFLFTDKGEKTILLTSSMSGEGKSFIATNLAITLALSGKKVVLLEMDLRKPKTSKMLGIDNSVGFSSYIIGNAEINDIIKPSGIEDSLYVISSGPIPPNPAELIMTQRTEELFEYLRENFDYVIIDTAPVGLVTDAQLLNKYADVALYVVRQGFTYKQQLMIPNDLYHGGKMPKLSLIVNDVVANRGYAYGYGYEEGYGYGYGYGYGSYSAYGGAGYYFDDSHKKRGLRKLIGSRKNK